MSLTKEKQLALLKLGGITVALLLAIWFSLVYLAQVRLNQKSETSGELEKKFAMRKEILARRADIDSQLQQSENQLREIEGLMVKGDIYLWIQKTLRDFEIPGQIEFTKYDPPAIIDPDPPLKVPYRVASFAVNGTATYHDLGTFLANFENSYPHIRIHRLEMEPASVDPENPDEKLSFFIELEALIRPKSAIQTRL